MALPIVVIGILLAVLAGAWIEVRHADRAERLADRLLMGSLYLLAPPVIFFNLVHLEFSLDSSLGLVLAWVAVLGTGLVAYLLTRNRLPRPVAGAVIVSVLSANTGYLGYPLTTIVFGTAHLPEAVSYDALVTIPILVTAAFAVGAAFGEEAGEGARQRARSFIVRNPLLPVFALALVAPDSLAPPLAVEISQIMVFALLPVGFFAVGVHLAATSPGRLSLPPLSRPGAARDRAPAAPGAGDPVRARHAVSEHPGDLPLHGGDALRAEHAAGGQRLRARPAGGRRDDRVEHGDRAAGHGGGTVAGGL